jgi:hypothetical protein
VTTLRIRRRRPRLIPAVREWLRDPRLPDWVRLAAAVAVLMPAVALLVVAGAAGNPGAYRALGGVLALAALAATILRPRIAPVAIAAIVMANAGVVISDRASVPNILHAALALAAIALLARPAGRARLVARTPVMVVFLVFAAVRWLSALLAPSTASPGTVLRDLAWGLLLIAVITAAVADRQALRWTVRTVVAVAAALATLTILKRVGLDGTFLGFASDPTLPPEQLAAVGGEVPDTHRAAGPLGDPTLWAQALLLVLPLGAWIARETRGRVRYAWLGAVALIVAGVALTEARSAFIVLALVVGLAIWARGRRGIRIALAALAALTIGAGAYYVTSRYETVREIRTAPASEHEALRARLSENLAGLYMLEDHPLVGVGAGQFERNYQAYAARIGLDDRFERSAHNSYIQMAAESGLLGLAAFVAMLVATLGSAMRARRLLLIQGRVSDSRLAEALVVAVAGYAVMAVVLDFAFPSYLWLAMGLAAGMLIMAETEGRRAAGADSDGEPGPVAALARASAPPPPAPAAPASDAAEAASASRRRIPGLGRLRRRRGGEGAPTDGGAPPG